MTSGSPKLGACRPRCRPRRVASRVDGVRAAPVSWIGRRSRIAGAEGGEPEIWYLPDELILGGWPSTMPHVWNKAGDELRT